MGARMREDDGFCALELMPARASRAARRQPDWPFIRLESALRWRPRRALSSAEATNEPTGLNRVGNRAEALFRFCSHRPVRFCSHHDSMKCQQAKEIPDEKVFLFRFASNPPALRFNFN